MASFVEHIGAELSFKSLLQDMLVDHPLTNEEFHIGTITRTVPAKLREHEIVDFKGTKPKALELRIFRYSHTVEIEWVRANSLPSPAIWRSSPPAFDGLISMKSTSPVGRGSSHRKPSQGSEILPGIRQLLGLQVCEEIPVPRHFGPFSFQPLS